MSSKGDRVSLGEYVFRGTVGTVMALVVLLMGFGVVLKILNWALQYRWLLPFVAIALVASLLYLGIQDLRSKEAKSFPVRKGLTIFTLMVLIATTGFGALSLWLATAGWANYSGDFPADLQAYTGYYMWHFVDMIPVLEVTETLGLTTPVEPIGFTAGLPVLVFRILVVYFLLKALKDWWESRKTAEQS